MLVVTAGNDRYDYKKTILHCTAACGWFGYDMITYDLGGLGFGTPWSDPRCESKYRQVVYSMKPEMILAGMKHASPNELVVWIDGDATLISPIDELEADYSFDVGVTVRPKRVKRKTHYINAGVLFVRNTVAGRWFVNHWNSRLPLIDDVNPEQKPRGGSDQSVLEEELLLPNINVVPWDAFNTVHYACGTRVKFFEGEVYNNLRVHAPETWEPPGRAKILHFRNHTMDRLDDYVAEFL